MLTERIAIPIQVAIDKIMQNISMTKSEKVPLMEANGRYLAEDIIANQDVPAFNRSLYDGYAVKAEQTKGASTELTIKLVVVGHIGAGEVYREKLKPNEAIRIMTGAEMPADCDAVVMLEHVKECSSDGNIMIELTHSVEKNERVFIKGAEIQEGALLVKKGDRITPGVVGLLATFGYHEVHVAIQPKVGVLATGSELLEVDQPLVPGKIRNSNSYMLMAQIEKVGAEAIYLGKIPDDLEQSIKVIESALKKVDVLITTGGVSVGDFDLLPEIYERLGASVLFNKIAMRPGSVTTVAKLENQYLFGLSGNPSASFIGCELFVRPVLKTMMGNEESYLRKQTAILQEDYPNANAFTQLIRAKVEVIDGKVYVSSNGLNLSSSITSLVDVEAIIILPPTTTGYVKGSVVECLLLGEKGQRELIFNS